MERITTLQDLIAHSRVDHMSDDDYELCWKTLKELRREAGSQDPHLLK